MGVDSLYVLHHPSFTQGEGRRQGAKQVQDFLKQQEHPLLALPHSTLRALAEDPTLPRVINPLYREGEPWLPLWGESRYLSPTTDFSQERDRLRWSLVEGEWQEALALLKVMPTGTKCYYCDDCSDYASVEALQERATLLTPEVLLSLQELYQVAVEAS